MNRTYGALILAGGKGRRMGGANKALLQWQSRTFLSRLEEALSDFEEKLISVQDPSWLEDSPFRPVPDQIPDRGPLEGLRCALSCCRSDALLVVACDMPCFSAQLAQALMEADTGYDALVCRDGSGRLHPLCGIYSKQCLPVIQTLLDKQNYKVSGVLDHVHSALFTLDSPQLSDTLLSNVNTPEALEHLGRS